MLVNNVGYRQTENVWSPAEPGRNVVLTIDLRIQQAAEHALQTSSARPRAARRSSWMCSTGDILAMASSPDPQPELVSFAGFTHGEWQRITELQAEKNRATQENYMPGSIFKTGRGAGRAGGRAGTRRRSSTSSPIPRSPAKATFTSASTPSRTLAPPGDYDFRRALKLSSNAYFITNGLRIGSGTDRRAWPSASISASAPACPPARSPRHLPQPAAPQLGLDRRQHGQPLHRPGPGVRSPRCKWPC